LPIVTITITL